MKIPVYFVPVRGMESKEELVSKLLSIFADTRHISDAKHNSSSHWLIQCLRQMQNSFVLILDNADDLIESEDAKRKQNVLRFIDEILKQCKHIKLLLTTRESLDFLSHAHSIHLEKINVLDEVSSASLVKLLLPDVSSDDCSCIVNRCGQVPFSMRLMCSIMWEENISINDFLEELRDSTLVKALDRESFPDDVRLKTIINSSFQRLSVPERKAFVTLAVFPGWFGIEEATVLLDAKTHRTAKKIIRSLERKSLIDCETNFSQFRIHSLFQSFIDVESRNDKTVEAIFRSAQAQFYDYYVASFRVVNKKFLSGHSSEATATFLDQRESILLSLAKGLTDDKLYPKVVEVLSAAELLLCVVLRDEQALFEQLYDKAVTEAKTRQVLVDQRKLLAAKSFHHLIWFSPGSQTWDHSLYEDCITEAGCPAKLLCYYGIFQILCGKRDEGSSSLLSSVDNLSSSSDEDALKALVYVVLEKCLEEKDSAMSSHVRQLYEQWFESRLSTAALLLNDMQCFAKDGPFLLFIWKVASWLDDEYQEEMADPLFETLFNKVIPAVCENPLCPSDTDMFAVASLNQIFKEPELSQLLLKKWFMNDELSLDGVKISHLEPVRLRFLALTDQILQRGLYSVENYNAAKQSIESVLHLVEGWCGVSLDRKSVFRREHVALNFIDLLAIRDVLKFKEMIPSTDFVDLATTYDNLGKAQHLFNDTSGAIESHQQAIRLREENIGDHVDTVSSLTKVGCMYFEINNGIEADRAFQRVLYLRKQLGVCDHADTASIYFTLGENHYNLGNYGKALEAHLEALNLKRKLFGEHAVTAKSLTEVGRAYLAMESYPDALEFCEQALAMRLELLGEHKDTATSFHLLGCIYLKSGENMSAGQAFEAAASMRSNVLGDHEDTACSYHWLGATLREMGDLDKALGSLQKAWRLRKELLGGDHHDTVESLELLSHVYEALVLHS